MVKLSVMFIFLLISVLIPSAYAANDFSFNRLYQGSQPIDGFNYSINVNTSDNWNTNLGSLSGVNVTQFLNVVGLLNIDTSWLASFVNQQNSVAWNRSGTDVFLAKTGDSVGIGTGSPGAKLDVNGTIRQNDDQKQLKGDADDVSNVYNGTAWNWLQEIGLGKWNFNTNGGIINFLSNVNIAGDLNQTNGNATINMVYGEMWNHSDTGFIVDLVTIMVYANVTNLTDGSNNGFTLSNSKLISQVEGTYHIDYTMSFSGSANSEIGFAVGIGGQEQHQTHSHRKIGTGGDIGNTGGTGIITVNVGDEITLMARDEANPVQDIIVVAVNLNLWRIGN